MTTTLLTNDRSLRSQYRNLARDRYRPAASIALNKTAFDVLDAQETLLRRFFNFAGTGTQRFLSRALKFIKARPTRLEVVFRTRSGERGAIILEHIDAGTFGPTTGGGHLAVGDKLAIPVGKVGLRGRSGRQRKSRLPATILGPGGRAFISKSGNAIVERISKRSRKVRVVFALVHRPKLKRRLRWYETMEATARKRLPLQMIRALNRKKPPNPKTSGFRKP